MCVEGGDTKASLFTSKLQEVSNQKNRANACNFLETLVFKKIEAILCPNYPDLISNQE